MLEVPTVGTHSWKRIQEETVTLVGPMTLEESLQIRNNRLSILVTVSGIHSHSKTSKCMIMYNLPSSRGTMTQTLTLQVTRNQQHDTSRPSIQPNHQDYISDVPLAKNPSTGTAQQRLFSVFKVVLHTVVVISEILHLTTKSRC